MSTVILDDEHDQKIRLGSQYGGWHLMNHSELQGSTIISCGLGEDASFDIEFANRFSAKVIIVDPTPRSIAHFEEIISNLGNPASQSYVPGGRQPVSGYELSDITADRLILEPRALWHSCGTVEFFPPPNSQHVSHSISNYQQNYDRTADHILVDSITLSQLLQKHAITDLPLLKLDIEGAEIEVIQHMMGEGIYPNQVLVEYDELKLNTEEGSQRIAAAHQALLDSGYNMVHQDAPANFLYLRR